MKNVIFCFTTHQLQETGQKEVADHLIESLDAASCRLEETTKQMNLPKSSRRSWWLIQRLWLVQNPPATSNPPVKADAVASHLLQVARAPVNKKHKRRVQVEWHYFLQHTTDKRLPPAFTVDEIYQVLQNMKAGSAPRYDNFHTEFMKNLGPRAQTWLTRFFSRIIIANTIRKIWRKTKVIVIEKPGKDPTLAESYCPISLLSICHKLLERLVLYRVSPEFEKVLSRKQVAFRRNCSTCEQVVALTTDIKNGFQRQ